MLIPLKQEPDTDSLNETDLTFVGLGCKIPPVV